jgi:hypothetical protein
MLANPSRTWPCGATSSSKSAKGAGPDRCHGPAAYTADLGGNLDGEWVSDPYIVLTSEFSVELVRTYSNQPHLLKRYADLHKHLQQAEPRSPKHPKTGRTRALKRRVGRDEIDQIITKYNSGISTNQLMTEHHLAKRTITALLQANGVALRRQGLTDKQARQAAYFYRGGRSLAWIASHFGSVSPTTVARALRREGLELRPRYGQLGRSPRLC